MLRFLFTQVAMKTTIYQQDGFIRSRNALILALELSNAVSSTQEALLHGSSASWCWLWYVVGHDAFAIFDKLANDTVVTLPLAQRWIPQHFEICHLRKSKYSRIPHAYPKFCTKMTIF